MTLANCVTNKVKSGVVSAIKGKAAKDRFKAISDAMIAQGEAPARAYAAAADIVVDEMGAAAALSKHRLLSKVAVMNDLRARVDSAGSLTTVATQIVDDLDFDARAIHASAIGRIGDFLNTHFPDLMGRVKEPMRFTEFLKALSGEATSDVKAKAFADAVNALNEEFRITLNKYGFNIGKRDNWGLPHKHNAISIGNAKFETWSKDILPDLNWMDMTDPRTGKTFLAVPDAKFQTEFLRAAYDSIVYGRHSKNPTWGGAGTGSGNPLERHRVFAFKSVDAWGRYNAKYGEADPFNTLMQHIDHMSREVAVARRLGRDAETAVDYLEQYLAQASKQRDVGIKKSLLTMGNARLAKNMVRYMTGSVGPSGWLGAQSARFFSTTRKFLSSAMLERAVVISVPSDLNSARMAAKMIGINPNNFMSRYVSILQDAVKGGGMTRDDLLRQGHIADSLANPGVTASRFQQEHPAAAWAELLSNGAMRIQGMNAHTDSARLAWKQSMSAHFASLKDTPFDQIPEALRKDMERIGKITADDWDLFRNSDGLFTASNGATFLDPLYWRGANTLQKSVGPEKADELFLKMQAYVEKWTERAVPTGSLMAKGVMEPASYGLAPGSVPYEIMKSAGMFKSFPMAFVVNQARMINSIDTGWGKAAYVGELLVSTTLVGAIAIQVNELMMGRDPQDMTDDTFWWKSMLRGGGLGPVGDVIATGSTSWGGGVSSFLAGPIPQAATDTMRLTFGNVLQAYSQAVDGDEIDLNLIPEIAKFAKRYTPMAQTPLALGGAAVDRLIFDQFQLLFDPDSVDGLVSAAKKRANLNGGGDFWLPGDAMPSRGPDFGNAIGR